MYSVAEQSPLNVQAKEKVYSTNQYQSPERLKKPFINEVKLFKLLSKPMHTFSIWKNLFCQGSWL